MYRKTFEWIDGYKLLISRWIDGLTDRQTDIQINEYLDKQRVRWVSA